LSFLDYIIKIEQEHSYGLVIENFLNETFALSKNIGILYHLLHVGCSAKDVGATTRFL
jgi:hypothetical protein